MSLIIKKKHIFEIFQKAPKQYTYTKTHMKSLVETVKKMSVKARK